LTTIHFIAQIRRRVALQVFCFFCTGEKKKKKKKKKEKKKKKTDVIYTTNKTKSKNFANICCQPNTGTAIRPVCMLARSPPLRPPAPPT
jgi:hypothetical protein